MTDAQISAAIDKWFSKEFEYNSSMETRMREAIKAAQAQVTPSQDDGMIRAEACDCTGNEECSGKCCGPIETIKAQAQAAAEPDAIAAARVQAINECADLITPPTVIKRIDGKAYSTAMNLATAIRALKETPC